MNPFENTVKRAYALAIQCRHELVTIEHLLMALLENEEISDICQAVGGNVEQLQRELSSYLDDPSNNIIVKNGAYQPRHTSLLINTVKKAKTQSLMSNRTELSIIDLFLSLFNIENSHASFFLSNAQIEKDAVITHLKNKVKKREKDNTLPAKDAVEILNQFCINLNDKAKDGKIDPLIGREKEVETITQVMARRNKHNVIMLGDPGVGKTIIVEGLAKRIVEGEVPETLANKTIYCLDLASLVAGTKFRGDFEERMKMIIAAFSALPDSIMFIDEIHMIMGAGGGNAGALDAANLLKPALSRGEIRCIGSTTFEEYRKHFEKDRALGRRFQKIDINEPSVQDSKKIVAAIAKFYSQYHGVTYDSAALDAAVDLSVRYMHDKFLPDKAIDIIDSAGARQKIKPLLERVDVIGIEQIKNEVAKMARVPITNDKSQEDAKLATLEKDLKSAVFGQNDAIDKLVDSVFISRSGLRDSNKTQGAFLFSGPTGVGKTEIAKQLANVLGIDFVRFDMSEFQEKHTVSKFIGSPPGYVGYGDGQAGSGVLINALEKNPHCVILCDEIEKAHPDIVSIFLQVMDNGMISSQNGKTASARHSFLIFTSNLGAAQMEKPAVGFGNQERDGEDKEEVKKWFSPEFRNRLDGMIMFNRLSVENMTAILDKFIGQLNQQLNAKHINTTFDNDAKQWLIDNGFDRNMGARPLARIITDHVKKPLSREILFGKLKNGGNVVFTTVDKKLKYDILDAENLMEALAGDDLVESIHQ